MTTIPTIKRNVGVKPPRILLYGVRGIGKTTWGASMPAPVFIRTEDGLAGLDVDTFDIATNVADVVSQLRHLIDAPHNHKTLVLDSLSALERFVWDLVCTKYRDQKGNPVTSIEQFPYKSGYTFASDEFMHIVDLLDAVRDRGMSVLCIAHARPIKQEPPDADPYDKWGPSLHKDIGGRIMDWADAVLFVRYQMGVTEAKGRTRGKAVGSGARIMACNEKPAYHAKNRYDLPDEIEFSWPAFVAAVTAGQLKHKQQQQEATKQQQPQASTTY